TTLSRSGGGGRPKAGGGPKLRAASDVARRAIDMHPQATQTPADSCEKHKTKPHNIHSPFLSATICVHCGFIPLPHRRQQSAYSAPRRSTEFSRQITDDSL